MDMATSAIAGTRQQKGRQKGQDAGKSRGACFTKATTTTVTPATASMPAIVAMLATALTQTTGGQQSQFANLQNSNN
jgi:hypothetical protein